MRDLRSIPQKDSMNIPPPTGRRRENGLPPPVNRKRVKETRYVPETNAKPEQPPEKIEAVQKTQVLKPKLLPITKKGVCPYCSQHIGKGIFGHMQACQLISNSRTG